MRDYTHENAVTARRNEARVQRGHLAAAAEEKQAGRPLVVESIDERLQRLVPGARLDHNPRFAVPWSVWRGISLLSAAHSRREAIDRAITLWGGR